MFEQFKDCKSFTKTSETSAKNFPNSHLLGIDICDDVIAEAREEVSKQNLTNLKFEVQDATNLPDEWTNNFEWLRIANVYHVLRASEFH